jgi:hypothetical protein
VPTRPACATTFWRLLEIGIVEGEFAVSEEPDDSDFEEAGGVRLVAATAAKMSATHKRRGLSPPKVGRSWTPEEDAQVRVPRRHLPGAAPTIPVRGGP